MKYQNLAPARTYIEKKLRDKTIKVLFDEEKTKTEIARLVRAARESAGLSQREIAIKAKTTQAVVARLENQRTGRTGCSSRELIGAPCWRILEPRSPLTP